MNGLFCQQELIDDIKQTITGNDNNKSTNINSAIKLFFGMLLDCLTPELCKAFILSILDKLDILVKQTDNKVLENTTDIIHEYSRQIDEVIASFSEKSAKELELYSTIVFVTSSFYQNSWGKEKGEICKTVKGIKPHFSNDTICEAYDDLDTHKFLDAIKK